MIADTYYGDKALRYEASRRDTSAWKREDAAVADLLTKGPVLDAPCGTGRFISLYQERSLEFVGVDISEDMLAQARARGGDCLLGSIFDLPPLPFSPHTAVCIRLLHLLEPKDMQRAIKSLACTATEIIFSIRIGKTLKSPGWHTYSHQEDDMLDALGGMMITDRVRIDKTDHGEYFVIKARHVSFDDVLEQFSDRPKGTFERIQGDWAARMGVEPTPVESVRCEYWTSRKIGEVLAECAARDPKMIVTKPPRMMDRPLTCWVKDGKHGLIDGRHRANKIQNLSGRFPVLVCK